MAIYGHLLPVRSLHRTNRTMASPLAVTVVTLGALLSTCEAQWTIALELLEAVGPRFTHGILERILGVNCWGKHQTLV